MSWLRLLEARFAVPKAIQAARGALGLAATLKCWRSGRGSCRVALPGAICYEVVVAVLAAGCEPIFCDVNPADGLVRHSEWRRARSLGADVALVVHLYGNPAAVKPVRAIFPAAQCLLIDDAAQALGSQSEDGLAGALGDVGLLSFGATKHIPLGNAALLFNDTEFAGEVAAVLDTYTTEAESTRSSLSGAFRSRLALARARLRAEGDGAAAGFAGLLEGMLPTLCVPETSGIDGSLLSALEDYPPAAAARVMKAELWSDSLLGTGLEPVGMRQGCVPWRYACRLPGASWPSQQALAEVLRGHGIHVSNWYLPAHWFLGGQAGVLPGVELLAREVFQFWVDEEASCESIVRSADAVRSEVARIGSARAGAWPCAR